MIIIERGKRISKTDELIRRLRKELVLSGADITDDQLLKATEHSFMVERLKLGIELDHFKKELLYEIKGLIK